MSGWVKEFRDFINRGNLVELAVAFVLGVAFAALVASFVNDIVMQIVAAIFGEPDFSSLTFDLGDSVIRYGAFLTQLINFLIIAFVLFLIVKAYNRFRRSQGEDPAGPSEIELLTEIRDALTGRRPPQ
jgi:large conductance mechanosensitive channel